MLLQHESKNISSDALYILKVILLQLQGYLFLMLRHGTEEHVCDLWPVFVNTSLTMQCCAQTHPGQPETHGIQAASIAGH